MSSVLVEYTPPANQIKPDTNGYWSVEDTHVSVSEIEGRRYRAPEHEAILADPLASDNLKGQTATMHTGQEDRFFVRATPSRNPSEVQGWLAGLYSQIDARTSHYTDQGSTAVTAVVSASEWAVTTALLGDASASLFILDEKDGRIGRVALTKPNSMSDPQEIARIQRDGGTVANSDPPRLGSAFGLAVCRSFGDKSSVGMSADPYQEPYLGPPYNMGSSNGTSANATYNFSKFMQPGKRAFLLVGCDGLEKDKKGLSLDSYRDVISECFKAGKLDQVASYITAYAHAQGSNDNVTALFMEIKPGRKADVVLGVYDGHGGSEVAQIAADTMGYLIPEYVSAPAPAQTSSLLQGLQDLAAAVRQLVEEGKKIDGVAQEEARALSDHQADIKQKGREELGGLYKAVVAELEKRSPEYEGQLSAALEQYATTLGALVNAQFATLSRRSQKVLQQKTDLVKDQLQTFINGVAEGAKQESRSTRERIGTEIQGQLAQAGTDYITAFDSRATGISQQFSAGDISTLAEAKTKLGQVSLELLDGKAAQGNEPAQTGLKDKWKQTAVTFFEREMNGLVRSIEALTAQLKPGGVQP